MNPRVSVIIRTYNRVDLLRAAIESAFAQTFRDFELIVADDGSTDATRDLVAQYADRITPVWLEHTGNQAAVMNAGIRAARGEFIAFLDDDDVWLPEKLQQQIARLDSDRCFGFCYGNARLLSPEGRLSAPALRRDQIVRGSVLRAMVRSMCVQTSTVVIRRAWVDAIGLFDERQRACEEYFYFLQLARCAWAICEPEPVCWIREHPNRLSSLQGLATYQAAIVALEGLLEDRSLPLPVRLEAHRSIARYHTHLAKNLIESGNPHAARDHLQRALRRYPFHRSTWRWVASAFAQ